jgi:hypothetical protein
MLVDIYIELSLDVLLPATCNMTLCVTVDSNLCVWGAGR